MFFTKNRSGGHEADIAGSIVHTVAAFGGSRVTLVSDETYQAALEAATTELRREIAADHADESAGEVERV